jgi:SAM-dependent methyltransferase
MRTINQLREHFNVEKDLANRLRRAAPKERGPLYSQVYDELFRRIPHHPQLTRAFDPAEASIKRDEQLTLLTGLLRPETVFLEIGAGDCQLAVAVAERVRKVYALDVSEEITKGAKGPPNFELVLSKGTDIPVPLNSVTVAYSYQVMEHIHPEDAIEQLKNIFAVLAPGGIYVCITPNRLSGPHDISKHFSRVAEGFHLKEYTVHELRDVFRTAGFGSFSVYPGMRGHFVTAPAGFVCGFEYVLESLPFRLAHFVANLPIARHLLTAVIACKPSSPA